jgi:hypothetical protein
MSDLSAQLEKAKRPPQAAPADDLVWGCEAIGAVLGVDRTKVYYLIKTNAIPVSRINKRTIVASRRKLQKWAAEVLAA